MTSDSGKLELCLCIANVAAGFIGALGEHWLVSALCYAVAALWLAKVPARRSA